MWLLNTGDRVGSFHNAALRQLKDERSGKSDEWRPKNAILSIFEEDRLPTKQEYEYATPIRTYFRVFFQSNTPLAQPGQHFRIFIHHNPCICYFWLGRSTTCWWYTFRHIEQNRTWSWLGVFQLKYCEEFQAFSCNYSAKNPRKAGVSIILYVQALHSEGVRPLMVLIFFEKVENENDFPIF